MRTVRLTLLGKPGCHLCDDARQAVRTVLAELATAEPAIAVEFDERSILDDAALLERHVEEIPVLLIDDRVHTIWRVDQARLRRALEAAAVRA